MTQDSLLFLKNIVDISPGSLFVTSRPLYTTQHDPTLLDYAFAKRNDLPNRFCEDVLALSKKDLDSLPATGAQEPASHSTV